MEEINVETVEKQANEIWQAEVLGQIYDTNFSEMAQWISEGALMPTDKVRRGKLRWLEAGRVPSLVPFFNAKERGEELPQIQTNYTNAENHAPENTLENNNFTSAVEQIPPTSSFTNSAENFPTDNFDPHSERNPENMSSGFCALHSESPAVFYCETCANEFCAECPKRYGGTVRICPMCGALCRQIGAIDAKKEGEIKYRQAASGNFGFAEIAKAFVHPFKFKVSLIFGTLMFMLFTVGQSALGFGGASMGFSALFCFMLANMLAFGIIANTIEKFSQGKTEKNFMPDFEDFNLWDDVLQPFFLTVGIYISSLAPFVLVIALGIFVFGNAVQNDNEIGQSNNSPLISNEQKTLNQANEIQKTLANVKKDAAEKRAITENGLDENQLNNVSINNASSEEKSFSDINKMIAENQKNELESVVGKTTETEQNEYAAIFSQIKNQGAILILLGFASLLWAIFYFPAACAVAGYTKSLSATVNPVYGIEFIKNTGADYFKILSVFVVLLFAGIFFNAILQVTLSPFDLPALGNIPATAIAGLYTFYATIVFSCLLGYAAYKNADKLGIYRG